MKPLYPCSALSCDLVGAFRVTWTVVQGGCCGHEERGPLCKHHAVVLRESLKRDDGFFGQTFSEIEVRGIPGVLTWKEDSR